jgi:DNA-binding FrmR family transcriptional regulator
MSIMTHHKLPEVAVRMARIEGHIKGIRKMIDEGKGYSDIMHQITAVRAALDGVVGVIVEDLIEHVTESPDIKRKQAAMELKETVSKLI